MLKVVPAEYIRVCDRCGKEVLEGQFPAKTEFRPIEYDFHTDSTEDDGRGRSVMDLCTDCYAYFKKTFKVQSQANPR